MGPAQGAPVRHLAPEPKEVAGNSEQGAASSKLRTSGKLEVARLVRECIQSGVSSERAERVVSDTGGESESGAAVRVPRPVDPPSIRPVPSFPPLAARSIAHSAPAATREPGAPREVAAASRELAPASRAERAGDAAAAEPVTPPPGAAAGETSAPYSDASAAPAPAALRPAMPALAVPPEPPAPALPGEQAAPAAAGESQLPRASAERFSPGTVTWPASWSAIEAGAAPREPARDAPPPDPVVHIGNIEIIIEAPAEAPAPPRPAAPAPDFASRFYLRGL